MNKIVEQSRASILTAGENICKILSSLVALGASNHTAQIDLTKSGDYSSDFVQGKIKQLNAQYHSSCEAYAPKLLAEFDTIEAAGLKLENALDITDGELASALSIIEASNGKLDMTTEALILNTFKGNQLALRAVKSVYKRWDLKTEGIDKLLFSINDKMTLLRANIDTLTSTPYENPAYVFGLRSNLMKLCQLIGAEVPGESFSLGEHEADLSEQNMRKSFGLSAK